MAKGTGYYRLSRCMREHPIVGYHLGAPEPADKKRCAYAYGFAWQFLIEEAAYRPRVKVVYGNTYQLSVGELVGSERFLAEAWNWHRTTVRRFLKKLCAHGMLKMCPHVGRKAGTISVCNYAEYQQLQEHDVPASVPTSTQKCVQTRIKDNTGNKKTPPTPSRGDEPVLPFIPEAEAQNTPKAGHDRLTQVGNAPALEASEVRIAFDRWNAVAKTCALPTAKSLTEGRAKKIRARLKVGGLTDWDKALSEVARSKFMRGLAKPTPGRKPFKADLEFVLQEKSYNRLVEGFYTRNAGDVVPSSGNHSAVSDAQKREAEILAELRQERATVGKVNSILT